MNSPAIVLCFVFHGAYTPFTVNCNLQAAFLLFAFFFCFARFCLVQFRCCWCNVVFVLSAMIVSVSAAAAVLNGLCASALPAHCYKDPQKWEQTVTVQCVCCIRNWDGAY